MNNADTQNELHIPHYENTPIQIYRKFHYENTPIQIYRKFHLQKLKIFR